MIQIFPPLRGPDYLFQFWKIQIQSHLLK